MEEKEFTIDFMAILRVVIRRIWIVILSTLVCAGIGFIYTYFFVTPRYTSYTTLYVVNTEAYASTVSAQDLAAAQSLATSYVKFLTSNSTMKNVSKAINNAYTAGQLKGMVSASKYNDTEILQVTVTCPSRADAKKIADLVAQEGTKEIIRIVKSGSVSVVDEATDAYRSSPDTKRNVIMASGVGFALSLAIIVIVELLDKRIKTSEQISDLFGYDVLGIIPSMSGGDDDE